MYSSKIPGKVRPIVVLKHFDTAVQQLDFAVRQPNCLTLSSTSKTMLAGMQIFQVLLVVFQDLSPSVPNSLYRVGKDVKKILATIALT